jgi:hypothetical protein
LLPGGEELPPERGLYRKTLHWRVAARGDGIPEGKHSASIRLSAPFGAGEPATAEIEVDLPEPNRVDVYFTRAAVFKESTAQAGTVALELFANRETKFKCELVNRHDRPKTVEVFLYAVSPRTYSQSPIGRMDAALRRSVYDDVSRVFLDAKLIGKSAKPIALPEANASRAGEQRVLIDFTSAAAPPPAPAPKDGQPAPAAAPPPPAAAEPIHGLVLKTVDVNDRRQEWIHWVEFTPLSPREYLDADIGYDQRQQQIVARFRPKIFDERQQPRLPGGNPIEFKWDPAGANLPEQGKQQLEGKMDPAAENPQVLLRADAPADDSVREVRISVDGFPRAFLYRVPCRRDAAGPAILPGTDLARERTAIRIESVSVPGQLRVYHYPPHVRRPPPAPDAKPPKIEHIDLQRRQAALFSGPADTLVVHLQVDAPLDAFTNSTDGIVVKLQETDLTRNLRAIRDLEISFVGCAPGGLLELKTRLGDLSVPLEIGSLLNATTIVNAGVRFRDQQIDDFIEVQIDGSDPIIQQPIELPRTVLKDGKATATYRVSDYSGVAQVVYGFTRDGTRRLVEATAIPRAVKAQTDELGRFVFSVPMDFKDMPVGNYLLVAKVVDLVNRESALISREFAIVEPPPVQPTKGEIRGVIRAGRSPVNGNLFEMTIEGGDLGVQPVPIAPDGRFLVPDLAPGEYVLKPKGAVAGKSVKDKEFKLKPTDPKAATTQTLNVSD